MPIETAVREAISITKSVTRATEKLGKKAWSITDAASEKQAPGDYLSPQAIKSIQGN
jgi:hypothetical protein